ncbi:D-galacturonate reductase-like protein [Tanacetum coccineum]
MVSIPTTTISSRDGRRPIPLVGMGTATLAEGHDHVKAGIIEAIKVGYRHFDTASLYKTEKALGEAIKEALNLGLINSRADLFITTKLWCNSTEGHLVVPAMKQSLEDLELEYVDLYLIHWPITLHDVDEVNVPVSIESIAAINIKDVWEGMEKCQDLGLTKSIGVSNFGPRLIEEILSFAKISPAVNQAKGKTIASGTLPRDDIRARSQFRGDDFNKDRMQQNIGHIQFVHLLMMIEQNHKIPQQKQHVYLTTVVS